MAPELEAHDLATELIRSSRLDAEAVRAGPRRVPAALIEAGAEEAATGRIQLGGRGTAGLEIDAVLRRRTSIREYGTDALTAGELASVLGAAVDLDADLYPTEVQAGLGLELLVAAWRVEGLGPGFYVSRDGGAALERRGALPTGDRAEALVLQREYARAPALIVVLGNLAGSEARHGPHGHRLLLARAGVAAHAGWLAAIGLGLDGSVFAGLLPGTLRILAGVDGHRRAQLFALSVGHPSGAGDNGKEQR